ncbi:hypothetical protein Hanom_Chr15g01390711 [Helianthus anomalus]
MVVWMSLTMKPKLNCVRKMTSRIPVGFLDRLTTGGDVEEFPFWWIGYYENGGVSVNIIGLDLHVYIINRMDDVAYGVC